MSVVEREVAEAPAVAPVTRAALLHRAAYLLDEFGWQQAAHEAGISLGADVVNDAWTMDVEGYESGEALTVPLARWNDEPGRTKAEVVAKLRAAAESA